MKLLYTLLLFLSLSHLSRAFFNYKIETKKMTDIYEGLSDSELARKIKRTFRTTNTTDGYCETYQPKFPTHNGDLCGSLSEIGYKIEMNWIDDHKSSWEFQIPTQNIDKAAIFVDSDFDQVFSKGLSSDMEKTESTMTVVHSFEPGFHKVQIYVLQNQAKDIDIMYTKNDEESWKQFDIKSLNEDTPEPRSYTQVESRDFSQLQDKEDKKFGKKLERQFEKAKGGKGFCTVHNPKYPLQNHKSCNGPATNIIWKHTITLDFTQQTNKTKLDLLWGIDFTLGAAIFIDGYWYRSLDRDMYWQADWDHKDVIRFKETFEPGKYEIVLYGRELCCDYQSMVKFQINDNGFHPFTAPDWRSQIKNSKFSFNAQTRQLPRETLRKKDKYVENYRKIFETQEQPEGYCMRQNPNWPIHSVYMCQTQGPFKQIMWKFDINFVDLTNTTYEFQLGGNFGYGSAVYINGDLYKMNKRALTWEYADENKWDGEHTEFSLEAEAYKAYNVEIYAGDKCCAEMINVRYRRNKGEWKDVKTLNSTIYEENQAFLNYPGEVKVNEGEDNDDLKDKEDCEEMIIRNTEQRKEGEAGSTSTSSSSQKSSDNSSGSDKTPSPTPEKNSDNEEVDI